MYFKAHDNDNIIKSTKVSRNHGENQSTNRKNKQNYHHITYITIVKVEIT